MESIPVNSTYVGAAWDAFRNCAGHAVGRDERMLIRLRDYHFFIAQRRRSPKPRHYQILFCSVGRWRGYFTFRELMAPYSAVEGVCVGVMSELIEFKVNNRERFECDMTILRVADDVRGLSINEMHETPDPDWCDDMDFDCRPYVPGRMGC